MNGLRAREGDFIETQEGLIFDVKGLVHPQDRVVAYLRYLEDPSGDRRRGDKTYTKVYSLSDSEHLQEVPHESISEIHQPAKKVSELLESSDLDQAETEALELIQSLQDSTDVCLGKIGLSGSLLVGLHTEVSDIDVVVYGRQNCLSVHQALAQSMRDRKGPIQPYNLSDLRTLYEFRSKDTLMPLQEFIRLEQRKSSQGRFKRRDFFVRFLLDWDEVDEKYGDRTYMPAGYTKIEARVVDDSEAMFTPCRYIVSQVEVLEGTNIPWIKEIASLRGRFCEQAKRGERVIAQGKAERVVERDGTESFRLILGAKSSDFMISKPV